MAASVAAGVSWVLGSSCAPGPRSTWQQADEASWRGVREALESERAAQRIQPWTAAVGLSLREPRTGRELAGRGAVAVAPGRAMRLVLVGAAGMTALDAWVTPTRWRISLPPAGIVRQGGREEPDDLPVAFLRWVLLRPLTGTLVAGSLHPDAVFVLRDGEAMVEVRRGRCPRGELLTTTRRERGREDRIDHCHAGPDPAAGDWVHYGDERTGLRVDLALESNAAAPPSEEAFEDPAGEGAEGATGKNAGASSGDAAAEASTEGRPR